MFISADKNCMRFSGFNCKFYLDDFSVFAGNSREMYQIGGWKKLFEKDYMLLDRASMMLYHPLISMLENG